MKVYTRKGDKGYTALYTGERRRKDDPIFMLLGEIDELVCRIGNITTCETRMQTIQHELMTLSSWLASTSHARLPNLMTLSTVSQMEGEIDDITTALPKLRNFILPSGPAHSARVQCRKVERLLNGETGQHVEHLLQQHPVILKYINRLSDYLFTIARKATRDQHLSETLHK